MMNTNNPATISFAKVATVAPMSEDTRAAVRENVLQFYIRSQPQEQNEPEGLTALYERLSQEDKNDGEKQRKELYSRSKEVYRFSRA